MGFLGWLLLVVLLVAVFGVGTVLEAAFWLLFILALVVAVAAVGVARWVRARL